MKVYNRGIPWRATKVALLLIYVQTVAAADDWLFTSMQYSGTIRECDIFCDRLYVTSSEPMGIHLPERPRVAAVTYKIARTSWNQFQAESLIIGDFAFLFVRTKTDGTSKLNRERRPYYQLGIEATITFLDNRKVFTASTNVDITVLDVNDVPPLFAELSYTMEIANTADIFSTIGSVKATDADEGFNAEIYYSFEQWLDELAIHPTSGDIYITRNLTHFSGRKRFTNNVIAANRGSGRESTVPITFNIVQRNSHSPEFDLIERPPVNAYTPVGVTIMIIKVADKDPGENGEVDSLNIISAVGSERRDARSSFALVASQGAANQPRLLEYQLTVADSLENLGSQVNITLQARDKGNPPRFGEVIIPLKIRLERRSEEQDVVELDIAEGLPAGTPLYYVKPPKNARDVTYRLLGGDLHTFSVQSSSGVLFLRRELDAEETFQAMVEVGLRCKIIGFEDRFEYSVKVTFTVRDENDNFPVFHTLVLENRLPEDSPIGKLVTIASATDEDADENSHITYSIAGDRDDKLPFNIDPRSGEIRLTSSVDYDKGPRVYHIPVRASDSGSPFRRETEKIFTVVVDNVNDNKPMFEYDKCDVTISQDITRGSRVSRVTALDVDGDLGEISYSVQCQQVPCDCMLQINDRDGLITTTRNLGIDVGKTVTCLIRAFDGRNDAEPVELSVTVVSQRTDRVNLDCTETQARKIYEDAQRAAAASNPSSEEITLLPSSHLSNDHSPVFDREFTSQTTEYYLPESLAVGSIVTHLLATDEDTGYAGLIQYHITRGNSLGQFVIDSSTGALIIFAPLDREKVDSYNLTVTATDCGSPTRRSASINMLLTVLDANDNTPSFLSDRFEVDVSEAAELQSQVLQVTAQDLDIGSNGLIKFTLVTDTPYFGIDSQTGRITVTSTLDRESKDKHILEVKASDSPVGEEEVKFATTTVSIFILDVNDNDPVFMKPEFKVRVREDMPIGAVITNLVAHDADLPATGGAVTYKIVNGRRHNKGDAGVENVFFVDRNTGVVKLRQELDFEQKSIYRMTVRAKDNGTEPRRSYCQLVVEVIDVNENRNRPVFEKLAYEGSVSEGVPFGSMVMQVKASDSDTAVADHTLSYSIRKGSGLGSFTIDSAGYIRTAATLDRESKSSYWLTVYVQDHGTVPLYSSVEVYINVTDVNDNAPEATQPIFYFSVQENSIPGLPVAAITAIDKDLTSEISYSFAAGNSQGLFNIASKSGTIRTTRRTLDRESAEKHMLEVIISDGGQPVSLSSSVKVCITITDENDNTPLFEAGSREIVPIPRSHNIEKPLHRVIASDIDKGENGSITYRLTNNRDKELWRVDERTGEIFLKSSWPNRNKVTVQVTASDGGRNSYSNSIDVQFEFEEAAIWSSQPPVISPAEISYVRESAEVFELVNVMEAQDPDSEKLWYNIVDGEYWESFPMFSIDRWNGQVKVAGKLDFESKSEYRLNVSVTDGYNTAYGELRVNLINENEFQPQFQQRRREVIISENVAIGSEIVTLSATDGDITDSLIYLLDPTTNNNSFNLFGINHITGVISTMRALDHERTSRHELIVTVNDAIQNGFSDCAKVVVHVKDYNDHPPVFITTLILVTVYEMSVVGTAVTQVQATDRDNGDNARIQYSLQSGNVGYTFNIDPELGVISLAKTLDLDVRTEYELVVMANDMGSPSLSSTCIVQVSVVVAEERAPSFKSSMVSAELPENEPIGTFVFALSGESQSTLTYSIDNEEDSAKFTVNPNSGILTSNQVFDFEERSLYNISLTATDIIGNPVSLAIVVHIIDKNDNRPEFTQRLYKGHVSEGSPDNSVILTNASVPLVLSAHDKDSNLNALLLYSIVEAEARQYFTVNPNTGAIQTLVTPDRELQEKFEFSVQVRDQGEESLSAADPARVIITIDDINDTPPRFDRSSYQVTLLVPTYLGVIVHSVSAIDDDLNSILTYEIVSGNTDRKFAIDTSTGAVYIQDSKNLRSAYNLGVKVTDGVHEATYFLSVAVQETSSGGLVFSKSIYTAVVSENKTSPQHVTIVQPMYLELGAPVTFELLNHRDKFQIGRTSGVLETVAGVALDREAEDKYEVIVRVQLSDENELTQVPVIVTVSDTNDNAPYFLKSHYYAATMVTSERGKFVVKLDARDNDEGDNKQIRYEISETNQNEFKIGRKNGEVTVKRDLTDNANREYNLIVTAEDLGEPPLSTQTLLTIKVYTASTPNFTQVVYESSIPENIPISSAVTTVSATSPNDNKIIYTIVDGDPNSEFTVHFSTGTVRVNDDLDFDLQPLYKLKVRAVDVITGDWADAVVIVNIQDVNDQKPYFDKLDYHVRVSEAITVGSQVLAINASDEDQGINSLIHYKLMPISFDQPDYLMFDVQETGGIAKIHTVTQLDHETNSKLNFILVATDGGNPRLSAQAYIHISLTDLNDNAPVFEEDQYDVEISNMVTKGQFISMVSAIDADESNEGTLMYNIVHGNVGQAFTIDENSGSIYVSRFQQPSMFISMYTLNVSVTDGIYTCFTSLTIRVTPANRHSPEFEAILYNFKVLENIEVDSVIDQVVATDEDEGEFGVINFSIIGEWLESYFGIHNTTGDISLKRTLDREERDYYMLPVMAQDSGGRTKVTSVYVVVDDVNDHAPEFVATGYNAAVRDDAKSGSSVLAVTAFDLDSNSNAELFYSMLTDDAHIHNTFSINNRTGEISLKRDLTSDEPEKEFTIVVKAQDSGKITLNSSVSVDVTVTSLPVPVFTSKQVQIFVKESEEIGSEVTKVTAEYRGDSQLSYRIKSGSSVRTNRPSSFVVNSEGRIFTQTSLDSENQDVHELLVEAYTQSVPELVDSMLVVISLIGTNDNPPRFTSSVYTVGVSEDTPIGSSIIQVSAFDVDQDHSTKIVYSFAPRSSSYENLFMIQEHHGWISSLVPLDRETQAKYEFYVQASDEDDRGILYSEAKVVVNLLDVNDCPPRFPTYRIQEGVRYWNHTAAAVNEDAPLGTIVVTVRAVDDDLPEHSTNMYYISKGNERGHFRIKQSGEIYVSKLLDREKLSEHHLEISATDGAFVTTIFVQIAILDANDNAPICDRPIYTKVLAEDVDVGTRVLAMKAEDKDEPGNSNSRITFSLDGEGADDFAIDSIRGDIRVHKRLDRERISRYRITGKAADGQGLFCVSDIVFELTDVNDNNPVFDQSIYTYTLPEDSVNNTLLLRVTATDKDTGLNRKVRYSMHSGDTDMFAIDPSNGIVRLIKPIREDKGAQAIGSSYSVVIAATDGAVSARTGTAQLRVHISDVNDPPVFQSSLYNKSAIETTVPGTELLQVRAESSDQGLNNVISYRISNGGANDRLFSIDPDTGMLSTNGSFDYEIVKEYVLNIEAKDKGEPPLSDMCMVTVYITDANDNKPTFSQTIYTANVGEDAEIGDHVIQVEAQDLDSGPNAEISYSIVSGDALDQFFIDTEKGYISVAAPLDREAIARYNITVEAKDNGQPTAQTSQAIILIFIGDINDNRPTFSQLNYTGEVQVYPEGAVYRNTTFLLTTTLSPPTSAPVISTNQNPSPDGTAKEGDGTASNPLRLAVTDADAPHNSVPFRYTILSGDDDNKFRIGSDGLLLAQGIFDMKLKKHYLLQVKVEDSGVPSLSSTTYVRLEVREAILHPPVVVSPRNFTVVAYEGTFPGGIIGYVQATDADSDKLRYNLVSEQFRRLFSMDSATGAFGSYSLDAGIYVLNVSVSDSRFERFGIIEVKVVTITDEMMTDSVAVRIAQMTAKEFLSLHRRAFEQAVVSVGSSEFRRAHILSITEDSESSGRKRRAGDIGVTILIAIEAASGQMVPKEEVSSALRENADTVESMLGGYEVSLPADNFDCSSAKECNADERCEVQYQITQDKVTIHAEKQSYVSLLAQPLPRCVCMEPETCANPCSTNPCPSNKYCVANNVNSHSCKCPTGTFGNDCERRDGTSLAFDGNSYARWTLVNDIKQTLQVKLTFRTKQSDAVLMDARGDRDYSTLEIVQGKLQYMFECGSGPAAAVTDPLINDGNWHNVSLERKGNFARLLLDDTYSSEAQSERGTEEINLLDNNVYFGATVVSLPSSPDIIQGGFKGCMKNLQMDRVTLPYIGQNRVGHSALFEGVGFNCHEGFYGECSINPCLNHGVCIEQTNGVLCSCKGYEGARCQHDVNECLRDNPCALNSTCQNTPGSYICHCPHGKAGPTCRQGDACLSNPCPDYAKCVNLDLALGRGEFMCQCSDSSSEIECSTTDPEEVVNPFGSIKIIAIVAGGCFLVIIILLVVIIMRCVASKRSKQRKMTDSSHSEHEMFNIPPQPSHVSTHHRRTPSPQPPSVPPRPASYTPSAHDGAKNYGDHNFQSIFSPEFREEIERPNPHRTTSTFVAPKLSPLPASVSDTDSIRKPGWNFDYPTNEYNSGKDMMSSGKGSDRPSHKAVVSATPQYLAKQSGSKHGSKESSKPPSITNGSFVSLPQEDEVRIAPHHRKSLATATGRNYRPPQHIVAKGYHWDTSDWVTMDEDDDPRNRQLDRHGYPAARLLSMSEVDDSEYVGDSELDDDVVPSGNPQSIAALQAEYKLDYNVPEIYLPKADPNHYLPSHGIHATPSEKKLRAEGPQSSLARVIAIPAVPQRTASLSYSTEELDRAADEERRTLKGYTDESPRDSDSDEDMEGLLSKINNKHCS